MSERPSILYIFTDQQSSFAMSCMGNDDLYTPNMDRLAARGVLFRQTYCAFPLCTPSRAAMFTGVMPHECGIDRNSVDMEESFHARSLGRVLSQAGYDCAYGGKWHIPRVNIPEDNPFGFHRICGFDDNHLADACLSFLAEKREAPFFLVASFDNPHNICEWGRNQALPWGPIGDPPPVADCPNLPANFAIGPYAPGVLEHERAANWRIYPGRDYAPDNWRRHRWAYFRLVEKVDAEIGRILDGLDTSGLWENTLVVFSSDHGDGCGAHQWNQKSCLYEEVARVPLIVAGPGVREGIANDDQLVNNGLDLFPTFCDFAGAPMPDGLRGRSLRPLLSEQEPCDWREAIFSETRFDGDRGYRTPGRMARSARYKYVCYEAGPWREQLFDLKTDPLETLNLAVERKFASVLEEHRRLLAQELTETNDPFSVPSGDPR